MHRSPRRAARLVCAAAMAVLTAGCSLIGTGSTQDANTVRLLVHDSWSVDQRVLDDFERESGIHVEVHQSGDAGALTNQLVLSKSAPLGDVAYGVDSTFASRALREGVFAPYHPPAADQGPQRFALTPPDRLTGVDVADVCVNVDHEWFAAHRIPEPADLGDLTDPRYRNLFAVPDPATSSPGLAFLLDTVSRFGENGWQDYWKRLTANGAKLSSGWEQAYGQDFSGSSGRGPRPIVLSYASSPSAEIGPDGAARTGALLNSCYHQTEYAGVLAGAKHPEAARKVVDFLLSPRFQAQVPEQMYVYPSVRGVPLPRGWERTAPLPRDPAQLPADEVERHRDRWVQQWRSAVRG